MIIVITGPAGAGKTTVSAKLAKQLGRCVNIETDHVKHFIVSGFSYKVNAGGDKLWTFSEWELLGDTIGQLAENFQKRGFTVIVNGHIDPVAWEHIQKRLTLDHKFLLLPHVAATQERDKQRYEDFVMGDKAVANAHDHFATDPFYSDFSKIDTTDHSVEETVELIAAEL